MLFSFFYCIQVISPCSFLIICMSGEATHQVIAMVSSGFRISIGGTRI